MLLFKQTVSIYHNFRFSTELSDASWRCYFRPHDWVQRENNWIPERLGDLPKARKLMRGRICHGGGNGTVGTACLQDLLCATLPWGSHSLEGSPCWEWEPQLLRKKSGLGRAEDTGWIKAPVRLVGCKGKETTVEAAPRFDPKFGPRKDVSLSVRVQARHS